MEGIQPNFSLPKNVETLPMHRGTHKCVALATPRYCGDTAVTLPDELWLALFTKCPDVDGEYGKELEAEGYERQPLRMVIRGEVYRTAPRFNMDRVSFGSIAHDADQVRHAGIVDAAGKVVGFAYVRREPGSCGANELAFDPDCVSLRLKRGPLRS